MSSSDYVPGCISQYLNKSGSINEAGNINSLFKAVNTVIPTTASDESTVTINQTDKADPEQVEPARKKLKECRSNAEKRIFLKPHKQRLQERKKNDDRTIFVGNVPLSTTKNELMTLFKKCGKIESIRFRSMPVSNLKTPKVVSVIKKDFKDKRTSSNAYVVFVNEESVQEALKLNNTEFKGQHLRVDHAAMNKKRSQPNSVFIGNLPFDVEEESLRNYFNVCGVIENIRLVRDSKTLQGKGIGYVTFQDKGSVDIALCLNGKKFMNRELRLEKAVKKKKDVSAAKNDSKVSKPKPKSKQTKLKMKVKKDTKKREIIAKKLLANKSTKPKKERWRNRIKTDESNKSTKPKKERWRNRIKTDES